jgi:hypothetical protein
MNLTFASGSFCRKPDANAERVTISIGIRNPSLSAAKLEGYAAMKSIGVVCGVVVLSLGIASSCHPADAAALPESFDVQIAYRIGGSRNQHVMQYYEMQRYFKKIGFVRDPAEEVPATEPEDPQRTQMRGAIPSRTANDLLYERHVRSIQLMPQGSKLSEDKAKRVRVEIELHSGLNAEQQYQLSRQTFEVLAGLSFFEAVGYDHRGYTRLVGSLPSGQLAVLLTDIRDQPSAKNIPAPFRNVWAVRVSKVFPDLPAPTARPRVPRVPKEQEKLSPDLRELLNDAAAGKPTRMDVVLAHVPDAEDTRYIQALRRTVPGLVVEGRLGPLVAVVAPPSQAVALGGLPDVVGVRLPRLPQPDRLPASVDPTRWKPLLDASGAARLHAMGKTGRGTRLALIDSDFRGWEKLVGNGLPRETRLLDLTAERNRDMQPDPFPAGDALGNGTRRAQTIARLAPDISLTLIRIDPASPYLIETVARAIQGDAERSINLRTRLSEIEEDQFLLEQRRDQLLEERKVTLGLFPTLGEEQLRLLKQAEDQKLTPEQVEKLPAVAKLSLRERAAILYRVRQRIYDADSRAFHQRLARYLQYKKDLQGLRGIRVVASSLSWTDGFPADGTSALSRYFDDRPFRSALWFQAAGDTRGQSWTGLFRDADNNGVMEFDDPQKKLPAASWSRELNFLSWQSPDGRTVQEIPAGAKLRISLQWREAHDSLYAQTGEDPYRQPLARNMRIFLLRQLDPSGVGQPADDLEIVAQSVDSGMRLSSAANSAAYEITLDVRIEKAGRYALQIGGRAPDSIYPARDVTLPAMRKTSDTWIRLFVSPRDVSGRAVFHDYVTAAGSVGMPADARTPVAVGAADARGQSRFYSAAGAPLGMELLPKPDLLSFDDGSGTAEAAAFAAGLTALVPESGHTPTTCLQNLRIPQGGLLHLGSGDK